MLIAASTAIPALRAEWVRDTSAPTRPNVDPNYGEANASPLLIHTYTRINIRCGSTISGANRQNMQTTISRASREGKAIPRCAALVRHETGARVIRWRVRRCHIDTVHERLEIVVDRDSNFDAARPPRWQHE